MNKTAIITGAGKGVGKEIADLLIKDGYNLGLISRNISKSKFESNKNIILYERDLIKLNEIGSLCQEIKNDFNTIDILINNVGFNTRKTPFENYGFEEYNNIIDLNLKVPFLMTQGIYPIMKKQKSGLIINIVGAIASQCKENWAPYASSKAGLLAFSKVLSKEAQSYGIKVTSILPGGINTGFREEEKPEYLSPREVAEMIHTIIKAPQNLVYHEITIIPKIEKI